MDDEQNLRRQIAIKTEEIRGLQDRVDERDLVLLRICEHTELPRWLYEMAIKVMVKG